MFQFLIGRIGTNHFDSYYEGLGKFQFLIGRIGTR